MLKTVVVTGASRRLGLYLSRRFLDAGWSVIALTRVASAELRQQACQQLNIIELGDYTEASVSNALEKIKAEYKNIQALIHNASLFETDRQYIDKPCAGYTELFRVHMVLPYQLNTGLQALLSHAETPGNIIHITDIYANNPNEEYAMYCSTKAGSENLAKSFAKKFAPTIRVNTIQPGPIKFLPEHDEEHQQQVLQQALLKYEGGFKPVYNAVLSLIDNDYLTGITIKVDGGRSLYRG